MAFWIPLAMAAAQQLSQQQQEGQAQGGGSSLNFAGPLGATFTQLGEIRRQRALAQLRQLQQFMAAHGSIFQHPQSAQLAAQNQGLGGLSLMGQQPIPTGQPNMFGGG